MDAISRNETIEGSGIFAVKQGIATGDNDRFLRLLTEAPVQCSPRNWIPYAKGGDFGMFYTPLELAVKWHEGGREIKSRAAAEYGSASRTIKNEETFFLPGLTFSLVTQAGFSVRVLPPGCIYDMGGPSIFEINRDKSWSIEALLGVCNTSFIQHCLNSLTDSRHWHVITVQSVPIWPLSDGEQTSLSQLARDCAVRLGAISAKDESDGRFVHPFEGNATTLEAIVRNVGDRANALRNDVSKALESLDYLVSSHFSFEVSNLSDLRERRIRQMFERWPNNNNDMSQRVTRRLVSWAMGCSFGRWDVRSVTKENQPTELPDAFSSLPICPPGQLQNKLGLPLTEDDISKLHANGQWHYPLEVPWDGILVDDSDPAQMTSFAD